MRFLVSSEEVLLSTPLSLSSSLKSCVGVEALRLTTLLTLSFGSFGTIVRSRAADCCEGRFGRGEGLVGAAAGFAILLTGTETETVFVLMTGLFLGTAVPKKFMLAGLRKVGEVCSEREGGKNVVVDSREGGEGAFVSGRESDRTNKESFAPDAGADADAASASITPVACRVPATIG
jgi:hypothetical protein